MKTTIKGINPMPRNSMGKNSCCFSFYSKNGVGTTGHTPVKE